MMDLVNHVQSLAIQFANFTKLNPVVGGVIGVWAAGMLSVLVRYFPNMMRAIMLKQFTMSVTIHNNDSLFHDFATWYEQAGYAKKSRTMRAIRGAAGQEISMGYGTHYFWDGWRLFKVLRSMETANNSSLPKETIAISTWGRDQAPLRVLLAKCTPLPDPDSTRIFVRSGGYWEVLYRQSSRSMDSIFISEAKKKALLSNIQDFLDSKAFYKKHGIPYRMGLAFHGVPGTGKTSMVKALCAHMKRDLYIINLVKLDDNLLSSALNSVPDNAIVLIEDIDAYDHCAKRVEATADKPQPESLGKALQDLEGLTLSGILNAIDGAVAVNDRILVMTTNRYDMLDSALKRKGRIDFDMEFGYIDDESLKIMMNRIFPGFVIPEGFKVAEGLAPVDVQSIILEYKNNPEKVMDKLRAVCA